MSSYNPPTELLPRFNTNVFIQNANVSYPVAQGAITIPNQITIVNGSNTIIITPTSIIINGNPFSFANIAYLNLNQTFTGINTFTQKIIGFLDTNTPSVSITQFSSLTTGTLYIAPTITIGNINIGCSSIDSITGIGNGNINIGNCRSFGGNLNMGNIANTTTINGATINIGPVGTATPINIGDASSFVTLYGNVTTIGSTFINSILGRVNTDAINLYTDSQGTITFGSVLSSNTINGITTFSQALNAPTPSSLINTSQVPTTSYLTTYYTPLTGTVANATAITLTPNTTDTADYIPFSSTSSGSSNLKTSTLLLYNASTGNLTSCLLYTSPSPRD